MLTESATAAPLAVSAIAAAARATGVDFDFLLATAERESGLKSSAKATTSSATGLFQFVEQTWLAMIHRHGAQHGLSEAAEAVSRDSAGRYDIADRADKAAILALREDPEISSALAAELARENSETLHRSLGREPNSGEVYVAHFLGASGAARLIDAAQTTPQASAAELVPAAAKANRAIFYGSDGSARGAQEVYAALTEGHSSGVHLAAAEKSTVPAVPSGAGQIAYVPGSAPALALTPAVIALLARLDPLAMDSREPRRI